jgi:hypothetical protein
MAWQLARPAEKFLRRAMLGSSMRKGIKGEPRACYKAAASNENFSSSKLTIHLPPLLSPILGRASES